ncbi:hypothetical protein [Desulfuromonas sp. AOP6]|uniref:hypothetical protein n=1 Tax=Desulfuromonas sp. AOP6 TaxID=1566351 RepID=UPI001284C3FB|nr:hypothetical protein [Desulfuromonas sp. AOP6]BCA80544.1 hypothetical protein AOP6_2331 [Desulfuromonas sp. AOP6]
MAAIFIGLAVVGYLAFLVDWKGFMEAFRLGGWATIALYGVLTVLIYVQLTSHSTGTVPGIHH